MIVDYNSRSQRVLEPREFAFVENQIIAVCLRIVVAVRAQGIADDVETICRNQRGARRIGSTLQIVRRKDPAKIVRKLSAAQFALNFFQRVAHPWRVKRIDDYAGLRVQIADEEHVDQLQAKGQRNCRRKFRIRLQRTGAGREQKVFVQLETVRSPI